MTVRGLYVAGQSYEVTGNGYGPDGEAFEGKKRRRMPRVARARDRHLGCNAPSSGKTRPVATPPKARCSPPVQSRRHREPIERAAEASRDPFDSDRKRSTVIRKMPDGKLRAFINGAPDVLLERCKDLYTITGVRPMTNEDRQSIVAQNTAMAAQSLRVLGSVYRDLDNAAPAGLTAEAVEHDSCSWVYRECMIRRVRRPKRPWPNVAPPAFEWW
jgi:Ca2+-transporting ATPase